MKRRIVWAVLLAAALLALLGCRGDEAVEPPEDVPPPVAVPEEPEKPEPPAAGEEEPEEEPVRRPLEDWEPPEYVEPEYCMDYDALDFSIKVYGYGEEGMPETAPYYEDYVRANENFRGHLRDYSWYGDMGLFPFTSYEAYGLDCGDAYGLDRKYYSTALEYDNPCCDHRVRQDSNYRQFNSELLNEYRWYWDQGYQKKDENGWYDVPFSPKKPEPYEDPIILDAVLFAGLFRDASYHYYPETHDGESAPDWDMVSVFELAAEQGDWIENIYCRGFEHPAYTEVTGLCILNGDSRTEADYFFGSRARDIRITINGEYVVETTLQDTPKPQFIDLYYKQTGEGHEGVAKPVHIQIECLSRYSGEVSDIYMMEIGVGLTTNHPVYH